MPQYWLNQSILFVLLVSILPFSYAQETRIDIGRFSQSDLSDWEEKSFVDHTHYDFIQGPQHMVLRARTLASASGLFRDIEVDITKTPFINWSWKVDNIYQGNNEHQKEGDDYPARIYIVVSGGMFFWKTRAINYVWSSNQAIGSNWDSAYTGNAKMIAVGSGDKKTGQWVMEKRNVYQDLKSLFGEVIPKIHAIAVMSDSDNTKQSATAYYGDIYFSAE